MSNRRGRRAGWGRGKSAPLAGLLLGLGLAWAIGGCSDPSAVRGRQATQRHLDAGLEAWEAGRLEAAERRLSRAIVAGHLDADRFVQALLARAVVRAERGRTDQALGDLERALDGAPRPDRVLAIRAYILQREGKLQAARVAWDQARTINPSVLPYEPPARARGQKLGERPGGW